MIETRRLKNVVIFVQTILSFVLSRKIIIIKIFLKEQTHFSDNFCPVYGTSA